VNGQRLTALVCSVLLGGCETYDPPPEIDLVEAPDGLRTIETALELTFSEPVDPSSLSVGIWRSDQLDGERALPPDASPLVAPCGPTTCPAADDCGGVTLCLDADGLSARLTFGEPFVDQLGEQLLLVISPGLADLHGNARGTTTQLPFMISPEIAGGAGSVDVTLNSGVVTLISNLSSGNDAIHELYPNLYLRLLVDIVIDPDTGETWFLATVARLHEEVKVTNATSEAPLDRAAILDDEGWAVLIQGSLAPLEDGTFWLETTPRTVSVWVLGAIEVELADFQLRGTIVPGQGEDDRDRLYGNLVTSSAVVNLGAPNDLGPVEAAFAGDGLFPDEVAEQLPRLCTADPCVLLDAGGGDCQIETPWTPPHACP
jgi:hypothetical protein